MYNVYEKQYTYWSLQSDRSDRSDRVQCMDANAPRHLKDVLEEEGLHGERSARDVYGGAPAKVGAEEVGVQRRAHEDHLSTKKQRITPAAIKDSRVSVRDQSNGCARWGSRQSRS